MKNRHKRIFALILFLWVFIPMNIIMLQKGLELWKYWYASIIDLFLIFLFTYALSEIQEPYYKENKETFKNPILKTIDKILTKIAC